jgi:pre-rRNA-processing protein IPI3
MMSEVVICSSSTDPFVNVLDFRTGTLHISFKQSSCFKHALALVPYPGHYDRIGLIISAQIDKSLLHVYSFHKVSCHLN